MQLNFDARGVAPQQPMEPVPEGWYPVIISEEEPKHVKGKEQCWLLSVTMEIIDGQFKGRKLFTNLNLGNDNPQAVEIAQRELSALCHVTGVYVVQDTAMLRGKPFQVKVIVANGRNEIKGYKDMAGNDPGKTGAAPAQPTFAAPPQAPAHAPQQQAAPAGWGAPPQAPAQAAAPAAWAPPAQAPAAAPQPAWQPPAQPTAAAPAPWGAGAPAPAAQPAAAPAAAPWGPAPGGAPAAAPWGAPR